MNLIASSPSWLTLEQMRGIKPVWVSEWVGDTGCGVGECWVGDVCRWVGGCCV